MSDGGRLLQLRFLRLDCAFGRLQTNERVVARQEFLSAFDAPSRAGTVAYALGGLRADCDVLLATPAADMESLQRSADRLRGAGVGKYLVAAHEFLALGSPEVPQLGRAQYLLAARCGAGRRELAGAVAALSRRPTLAWHALDCLGGSGPGTLLLCESDHSLDPLEAVLRDAAGQAGLAGAQVFPCVRRDIGELLEIIG